MKHRLFGKKLGRNHNQRQALLRSLTKEMFSHGTVRTTAAKAKAVIPLVEKIASDLIGKSDLIAHRILFRYFQDRQSVSRLVADFRQVFAGQQSNFTRTKNIKYRQGDNALVVKLSFVKIFPTPSLSHSNEVAKKPEKPAKEVKAKKVTKPAKKLSKNEI